jgi:hypothetical protein
MSDIGQHLMLQQRSRFQPLSKPLFESIRCHLLGLGTDMRRREFLGAFGAAVTWPVVVRAQQPAIPVIGVLNNSTLVSQSTRFDAFRQGLKEIGFIEGRNVAIEYRSAEGQTDRLPELAAELARLQVNALFAIATPRHSQPSRQRRRFRLYSRPARTLLNWASSPASIGPAETSRASPSSLTSWYQSGWSFYVNSCRTPRRSACWLTRTIPTPRPM